MQARPQRDQSSLRALRSAAKTPGGATDAQTGAEEQEAQDKEQGSEGGHRVRPIAAILILSATCAVLAAGVPVRRVDSPPGRSS